MRRRILVVCILALSLGAVACGDGDSGLGSSSDTVSPHDPTGPGGPSTEDSSAPSIDSGPSGTVNVAEATFAFSCPEADCRFECRVDGAAWEDCTSPHVISGLAEGEHTFEVRVVGGEDISTRSWTVDTIAPETSLVSGPEGTLNATGAAFTFTCNEDACSFQCRINNGAWANCASPKRYRGLEGGENTFDVRAVDAAGNVDPTPASRVWNVDTSGAHWVTVPGGTFLMGNHHSDEEYTAGDFGADPLVAAAAAFPEIPVHEVGVSAFEMYAYEVTNGEYKACVDAGVCAAPYVAAAGYGSTAGDDPMRPVTYVNWSKAGTFCDWVGGRLPTEAEWEYAARGGDAGSRYHWGLTIDCTHANYYSSDSYSMESEPENAACVGDTVAVGSYLPNAWGLYDMAGNVSEWVNDWYQADIYHGRDEFTQDPQGPETGDARVMRGGHYQSSAMAVRLSSRGSLDPESTAGMARGFRCVR